MKLQHLLAALAVASSACPGIAASQSTGPVIGAGTPVELGGTPPPGTCLLSMNTLYAGSKAGQSAAARLKLLTGQVSTEMTAERAAMMKNAQALDAQKPSLTPADLAQKRTALAQQQRAFQAKLGLRNRELALTRQHAFRKIATAADPDIRIAYKARGCGILLNRDSMLGGNLSSDLTPLVVTALNGHLATMTFERERIANAGSPETDDTEPGPD